VEAQLTTAANTNASTPASSHAKQMRSALNQTLGSLNGQALANLQKAIEKKISDPKLLTAYQQSLQQAMSKGKKGIGQLLRQLGISKPQAQDVSNGLMKWAQTHAATLSGQSLNQALSLLQNATGLGAKVEAALKNPTAIARPQLDALLQQTRQSVSQVTAQQALSRTSASQWSVPNPPWLPQASSVSLAYTAQATIELQALAEDVTPAATGGGQATNAQPTPANPPAAAPSAPNSAWYLHLHPFGEIQRPPPQWKGIGMIPNVDQSMLYIDLSAYTSSVNLLFTLQNEQEMWSDDLPQLVWEQAQVQTTGSIEWTALKVFSDSTNSLLNSGIVSLQLLACSEPPQLRARLMNQPSTATWVCAVTNNAISATWVGPGGGQNLSQPLPAGSITKSVSAINGIASIAQPLASWGGYSQLTGRAFDVWMAERLRHKNRASTTWDYAHLCLAAIPTLWQAAVVPATDAATGASTPGTVWVIAVAGPSTPGVTDPTQPMADSTTLGEIHDLLAQVTSPFVDIQVSNPPYTRITVHAELVFQTTDTPEEWVICLQNDLILWLSPWPDASLGQRPADYYTRDAVAEFIRQRSYVKGINSIELEYQGLSTKPQYFTSALTHTLSSA
jgi:hypothetical protein